MRIHVRVKKRWHFLWCITIPQWLEAMVAAPPTCSSFCISVHRSRTSEPQWPAACTHAWAYCPATELRRLRGLPGKANNKNQLYAAGNTVVGVKTEAWEKINARNKTFQDALFLPGLFMDGWRSDKDHSVCRDAGWSQQPGDLLQVLRVLLQRDVLLRIFVCKTETDGNQQVHKEILHRHVFKYTFTYIVRIWQFLKSYSRSLPLDLYLTAAGVDTEKLRDCNAHIKHNGIFLTLLGF